MIKKVKKWVHRPTMNLNPETYGAYHHLVLGELDRDNKTIHMYFRMSKAQFDLVLSYVSPYQKGTHVTRTPISPRE